MTFYLMITGVLFLLVGLRALLNPIDAIAVPFGIEAEPVDARNYLRASAGGVTIAAGGVMVASHWFPALEFAAVLMAVTMLGGLLFGRAVSLVMDGKPGLYPWMSAVFELMGFLSGLYWLK